MLLAFALAVAALRITIASIPRFSTAITVRFASAVRLALAIRLAVTVTRTVTITVVVFVSE